MPERVSSAPTEKATFPPALVTSTAGRFAKVSVGSVVSGSAKSSSPGRLDMPAPPLGNDQLLLDSASTPRDQKRVLPVQSRTAELRTHGACLPSPLILARRKFVNARSRNCPAPTAASARDHVEQLARSGKLKRK